MVENPKQFYDLLDNFTTGVVIHDTSTEILFSNQAALNFLGLTLDQIKGKSATDPRWRFLREDGTTMPMEEYPVKQVSNTGQAIKNLIVGVLRPDLDRPLWAVCNAHPEFDQKNNIIQIVINFTEITDLKLAENELVESELRYRTIVETSEEGVWTIDAESRTSFVNKKMAMILGHTCEEMLGKPMFYFMDEEAKNIALINLQRRKEGFRDQHEFRLKHKDGRDIWTTMATSPLTNSSGTYIGALAMVTDITERKQAELKLKTALIAAETAVNIKSRFLDIAAHELRTPVSAFSLLLQFTQMKLEKGIPVDPPTLSRLSSQVGRISQLVVELLDVSRLERGVLTLKPAPTDVVAMITHCIEDFKLREPNRRIDLLLTTLEEIKINIDTLRIFQVFSNLIDNAIKYTPDNSPIEISMEKSPGWVRISIKDYGQGITEKQQAELFAPFSRGSTELTEQYGGLGLGLFISKEIVALHGGRIGVISKIGSGSTFYIELPTEIIKK